MQLCCRCCFCREIARLFVCISSLQPTAVVLTYFYLLLDVHQFMNTKIERYDWSLVDISNGQSFKVYICDILYIRDFFTQFESFQTLKKKNLKIKVSTEIYKAKKEMINVKMLLVLHSQVLLVTKLPEDLTS